MAEQEKGLNTKYKLAASIKECMKTTGRFNYSKGYCGGLRSDTPDLFI